MDLTYDELDAVLRDVNVPSDVRARVQDEIAVRNYLNRVDFRTDDAGVTHVDYKSDETIGPVSEASPSTAQTTAPEPTPEPTPEPAVPVTGEGAETPPGETPGETV